MLKAMQQFPIDSLDPRRRTGLILCGMGGPDGPDTIAPFLQNLFRDPAVIPLPAWVARPLGFMIGQLRAPAVAERYALMNQECRTPQLDWTLKQSQALADMLIDGGADVVPAMAMRYWRPFPEETVKELLEVGCEQFLIVPMYPQFSRSTSGSTLDFVLTSVRQLAPKLPVFTLDNWHLLPGYIEALAKPVIDQLSDWALEGKKPQQTALVYVAHSLPRKFIDQGDPYQDLTIATVNEVHGRILTALTEAGHQEWLFQTSGGPAPHLTFQSKIGPVKWIGPEVAAEISRLADSGCQRVFVQPVSFTCDHVETLVELDVELCHKAKTVGIKEFKRGAVLNLNPEWLTSMTCLLQSKAFSDEVA